MVEVFSEEERTQLEAAVAAAEAKTSAEIVVMVVRSATDYRQVEILTAAIASLALPAFLLPFTAIPALVIWIAQLAVFVALALLLPALSAGRLLVGPSRVAADVAARARAEFFAHGLRRTEQRAAVLLFVALGEHKVEILPDDAAATTVGQEEWSEVARHLAAAIKSGDLLGGLKQASARTAELLTEHLPAGEGSRDELPNVITS
jgi:putative membrane protein